ncbi:uncharacterized protein LOC122508789 [Leptopilina heterotoma]|uniref:uncharacterized protein LOC122508789 n=1 Tax=Leptopilina heterotoma TaxID=63436 RepID=UPI001CA815A4|nr:uncharacterized protein LOC122508789 [Leptopilina heterotoma]
MSLFDPLGLLASLIIQAKILIQDIWKEETQWDEKVSAEITKQWSDWEEEAWIKTDARKYHPFVAYRIAKILDSTATTDWRWVPTRENVADDATRSKGQEELQDSSIWYQGPGFLRLQESEWPVQKTTDKLTTETMKEMKKEFCCVLHLEEPVIHSHKQSQQESFPTEWNALKSTKEIPTTSKIFLLPPIFKDDVICLNGRITHKDGSTYQPIILHKDNNLVKLLIQHYHQRAGHHVRERVVNDLRELFWMTNIRSGVRRSWNVCLLCKHRRTNPMDPRMALLPLPRLQRNIAAFTDTGVDYFGPMLVTIGRRREKRYGVLFTCLTVRAVHVEIAASLDTDSMLMALRRMMTRFTSRDEIDLSAFIQTKAQMVYPSRS